MPRRPVFSIIAGPNGAGKSRLGDFYVHTHAFDGDLLAMQLRQEHPEWPERWVSGTVASTLEKCVNEALDQKRNFSFETNYANELAVNLLHRFKEAGYKICLYYFGLTSVEESINRVVQRSLSGGHNVTDEIIVYNFNEGISRINATLHLFDNISFVDGTTDYGEIIALYIKGSGIHEVADTVPAWFDRYFADNFAELSN